MPCFKVSKHGWGEASIKLGISLSGTVVNRCRKVGSSPKKMWEWFCRGISCRASTLFAIIVFVGGFARSYDCCTRGLRTTKSIKELFSPVSGQFWTQVWKNNIFLLWPGRNFCCLRTSMNNHPIENMDHWLSWNNVRQPAIQGRSSV